MSKKWWLVLIAVLITVPVGASRLQNMVIIDATTATDRANVTLNADATDNLDGEYGLVTSSVQYGRKSSSEVVPAEVDDTTHVWSQVSYEHHEIHSNSHFFLEDYTTLGNGTVIDFCIMTDDSTKWDHLVFSFESDLALDFDFYELSDLTMDGTLAIQRANNRALSYSGQHTPAASSNTVMTDSNATFTTDALIGWTIYNVTDLSSGVITDNDGTTVTVAALLYGTDNDWDQNDYYEINKSLTITQVDCTVNAVGTRLGGTTGGSGTNPARGIPGGSSRDNELVMRQNTKYLFRFTSGAAANDFSYNAEWYAHTDK